MPNDPTNHPTKGRCKRCGQELPRLSFTSPIDGKPIAERWCSDECYSVELLAISQQVCRAQRMRDGAKTERKEAA